MGRPIAQLHVPVHETTAQRDVIKLTTSEKHNDRSVMVDELARKPTALDSNNLLRVTKTVKAISA